MQINIVKLAIIVLFCNTLSGMHFYCWRDFEAADVRLMNA